jgi:hypothetical protein
VALLERGSLEIVIGKKQLKRRQRKVKIVELGDSKDLFFDGTQQFNVDID